MFVTKAASRWDRFGSRLSISKPKKHHDQNKLARVLITGATATRMGRKRSLGEMPVDVLVPIFLHLDVADVLSLAQV